MEKLVMELLLTVADYSDGEIRRVEDTVTRLGDSLKSLAGEFRIVDTNGTECAVVTTHHYTTDSFGVTTHETECRVLWGYTVEDRMNWQYYLKRIPEFKGASYENRFDRFALDKTPIIRQGTFMRMYVKGDVVTFDGVTTKPAKILDHTDTHITLKYQGQSYWAARGIQGYAPAEITVYDTTQAEHRITEQGNVSYAGNFPVKASWVVRTSDPRHEDCRACKKLQS
jgi:hypothetical protein|tara:strand:- start:556 stop:1233 length:678 start_codon:yes stop_codon:yes gene_type:complete